MMNRRRFMATSVVLSSIVPLSVTWRERVAAQPGTPTVLWHYQPTNGAVMGRALSASGDQLVALLGHGFDPGGMVVSLDPATGAVRWQAEVPESPDADPVIVDGIVYAGIGNLVGDGAAVYAFDGATGEQFWHTEVANPALPATPIDAVVWAGAALFVNRGDGVLVKLDAATGRKQWEFQLQKPPRGAPLVVGDAVYVSTGFDGARLFAIDAVTGDMRWSIEELTNPVTGPVMGDGLLYVPFASGEIVALDPASGEQRWRAIIGLVGTDDPTRPSPGLPLLQDGVVYVSSSGFYGAATEALDAATGAQRWIATTGDFSAGAPALHNGVLLVGSDSGELLGLDPATGAELWRLPIPDNIHLDLNKADPPSLGTNSIFVTEKAGGIVALAM